jgi:hypothetical protein
MGYALQVFANTRNFITGKPTLKTSIIKSAGCDDTIFSYQGSLTALGILFEE